MLPLPTETSRPPRLLPLPPLLRSGHAVDFRHQRGARVADAAEPSLEILAGPGVQEDLARVRGQRAARAGLLVDLAAVDEPADGVRAPFEGVGMEVGRGVEAEVDHGLVSALAGSVVVDLHLSRRLAEELEVDLVEIGRAHV